MNLCQDDLIKFYELKNHYSEISPNIGIIDSKDRFEIRVKEILKDMKHNGVSYDSLRVSKDGQQVTIFIGGIETTYIHIETLQDLQGRYFRYYM